MSGITANQGAQGPAIPIAASSAARVAALLAAAVAAAGTALLAGGPAALADNGPHAAGAGPVADTCAACHRTHTAREPGLLPGPERALCYTCHGGAATGAITDVQNGVGYPAGGRSGTPEPLRGGGFKYALIDSANPSGQQSGGSNPGGTVPVLDSGAPVTSTHSVSSSAEIAWGNGPISSTVDYGKEISLRCSSCHDPHGNAKYRTLRPVPRGSGADPVPIPDAATKSYTTDDYWQVADPQAPGFVANVSAWCATCHTRYLSDTSYTDSGDAVFTYRHRSDQTTQGSANCAQCHVAHGSNASVSDSSSGDVHNPDGRDGVPAGTGSRLLRIDNLGVCDMCHAP